MNTHLSEKAMMRWQAGEASELERQHIAECVECQMRTQPLSDALSWFGAAARECGAEKAALLEEGRTARAAAMQEWEESKATAARGWRSMVAAWALVSVALLLILGIGLPHWKAHRAIVTQAHVGQQQQQAKQELASDNALLEEVDQDVSQEVPTAMQPLSWSTSDTTARQ